MANQTPSLSALLNLPTGHSPIPVCIGDLPASDYRVSADTITFDIVQYMRDRENVAGVMLYEGDTLSGVIPRLRLFERLGQLYGVELFIRKPVRLLQQNLRTGLYELGDHLKINEAVQLALGRTIHNAYDPIITVSPEGRRRLLDMHTLLLAQSLIFSNINNLMSSLDRVARAMKNRAAFLEGLNQVINILREIVPCHGAAIYLHRDRILELVTGSGTSNLMPRKDPDRRIIQSATYRMMIRLRRPVAIEDVERVPDWEFMSDLGRMRCWLGIPLFSDQGFFGLISITRQTRTPFTKDEVDTAEAFTRLVSKALEEELLLVNSESANPAFRVEAARLNPQGNLIL